jgi:hypothetical protein
MDDTDRFKITEEQTDKAERLLSQTVATFIDRHLMKTGYLNGLSDEKRTDLLKKMRSLEVALDLTAETIVKNVIESLSSHVEA